ncbi:MAG: bifunctional nuclease family protein, partial [Deltaproteobacteria bacterium]|nr:bifunctional nuclease family protein [Deltaproteobacteria bacterium]
AIALRTNAPIYVAEEVLIKYKKSEPSSQPVFDREKQEKWAEILEDLDPSDFSKYKM